MMAYTRSSFLYSTRGVDEKKRQRSTLLNEEQKTGIVIFLDELKKCHLNKMKSYLVLVYPLSGTRKRKWDVYIFFAYPLALRTIHPQQALLIIILYETY